ncbi:DUF416 family protein [Vibrio sp.]|nr:DUF416 family protein [Vibrio sp.]
MLKNPLQLRLKKLAPWQEIAFMACLCERMYPNFVAFSKVSDLTDDNIYKDILDSIWESLTVKTAKVNFEKQLEKLEEIIPNSDEYTFYGVIPAIDACIALSTLLHGLLDRDYLTENTEKASQISVLTVAQLESIEQEVNIDNENQKDFDVINDEWDAQWEIFRLLKEPEERDIELLKGLRSDLRDIGISNLGVAI